MESSGQQSLKRIVVRRPRRRIERRITLGVKVAVLVVLCAIMLSAILSFLGRIHNVTVILLGAIFFTYAVYPAVRRVHQRYPLGWSIAIVYLAIATVVGFGLAVVVPALAGDIQALVRAYPSILRNAQSFFSNPNDPLLSRLPGSVRDYLTQLPAQATDLAQKYGGEAARRALEFLLSTVGVVATLIVIPVISAYLMLEIETIMGFFYRILPPRARVRTQSIVHDLDQVVGGFIRGQFLVGATIGACITVALLILKVKYAVLIGVTAGLLDIIPYVGAIVGFVPAVSLAFFNDGWQHALLVALVFAAIFQLEGHFIAPKIVSNSVGLSPLMVIVAILIGGELMGIAGMFLAVPIAAVLRVVLVHSVPQYPADLAAPDAAQPAVIAASPTTPSEGAIVRG